MELLFRELNVGDFAVRPSQKNEKEIGAVVSILEEGELSVGDLLAVAQYDLSSMQAPGWVRKEAERLARLLRRRGLKRSAKAVFRWTSSSWLFSLAIYRHLAERGLPGYFAVEPYVGLTEAGDPFDYALVKEDRAVPVEVKRLASWANLEQYIGDFREKAQRITTAVLHLHLTEKLCRLTPPKGLRALLELANTGPETRVILTYHCGDAWSLEDVARLAEGL
ncbi:hypothetical protein [Pyrobaculum neutrophilum]|uniref:Uncharacterized protein n=1 Tax=Pyrobaculum neutrophilum (strain DSM 2338 / JCM 9278 / NBRC 100436 / V24Sta) TaxID=444157 RepID=B1YE38_PYRNV|nr:hypothetical protein [Pyrobaculum neutrophilum]ACB40051.1 conserved hypothetical protein [Pyrobaculum neutrophilum V24Sta]